MIRLPDPGESMPHPALWAFGIASDAWLADYFLDTARPLHGVVLIGCAVLCVVGLVVSCYAGRARGRGVESLEDPPA